MASVTPARGVDHVMVRFTDHHGREVTGELRRLEDPPIGLELRVVYYPEDTDRVQLAHSGVPWARLLILAFLSVVAIRLFRRSRTR